MIRVPKIEMHLAHSCNLRCEGCSHFSNHGLAGVVPLSEGGRWLREWSGRIEPLRLSFLGGEPLLNDELPGYLRLARELWRHTWIRLITNGLLLPLWGANLWSALAETATMLTVSIHSRDPDYCARLAAALQEARARANRHGLQYEERNSVDNWYRPYRGTGPNMEPFRDGNPAASWKVCENKHCVTLQDNALWKCPPMAHLPRVAAKYGLGNRPAWSVPLRYRPLTLDASDDEIRSFFARKSEPVCGMCPAKLEYFEKSIY